MPEATITSAGFSVAYPGGVVGAAFIVYIALWILSGGAAAFFILGRRSQWLAGSAAEAAACLLAALLMTAPARVTPAPTFSFWSALYGANLLFVVGLSAMLLGLVSLAKRLMRTGRV